jgi:D-galactarolactone cycloisomerase
MTAAKIQQIDAFEVTLPLPRPLQLGSMYIPHREYSIVRTYDAEGNVGTAYHLSRNAPVAATVLKTVAPHWSGQPLDAHEACYDHTVRANVTLGTNGIFWRALSLVDCAVHDLLAKRAELSLVRYLGGVPRPIPAMLVGGYPSANETAESLTDEMLRYAAYRPTGIKLGSTLDWQRDTQRLTTARRVVPESIPLMMDFYWGVQEVKPFVAAARGWAELNMGWIEDPVAFDDDDSLAHIVDQLPYPVAVGDEQSGLRRFTQLMDRGRVGIVRLDATVCGGVRGFLAIARAAAERGLKVACHVHAHLHTQLACAVPNVGWVEYMPQEGGLESAHLLWTHDLTWQDGALITTDTDGIGYSWEEAALADYRARSEAR